METTQAVTGTNVYKSPWIKLTPGQTATDVLMAWKFVETTPTLGGSLDFEWTNDPDPRDDIEPSLVIPYQLEDRAGNTTPVTVAGGSADFFHPRDMVGPGAVRMKYTNATGVGNWIYEQNARRK